MIQYIDDRCYEWARTVRDTPGRYSSVLQRMMEGTGSIKSGLPPIPVSLDALEIEAAVCQLSDTLKPVVIEHYIQLSEPSRKYKNLRMSKKKYYDMLDTAHIEIDRCLGELVAGYNFFKTF